MNRDEITVGMRVRVVRFGLWGGRCGTIEAQRSDELVDVLFDGRRHLYDGRVTLHIDQLEPVEPLVDWQARALTAEADADQLAEVLDRYEHYIRDHCTAFELGDVAGAQCAHDEAVKAR